jgi:hypothetical protein
MWGTYGNTSQDKIQFIFLIISLVSIPLMLLPKPLYEIYCNKHHGPKEKQGQLLISEDNMAEELAMRPSLT